MQWLNITDERKQDIYQEMISREEAGSSQSVFMPPAGETNK